jgi:hypothetical protein
MGLVVWSLFALLALLQIPDIITTVRGLSLGGVERSAALNWLAARVPGGMLTAAIVSKALTLAFIAWIITLSRPAWWLAALLAAVVVLYCYAVWHNWQAIAQLRAARGD